ncbi:pectate lyase family protein [Sphingobium yanoikuyae]|uniref:Pectate lyase n=1 Tax=Sphingobium yanoikuyae TaxID=13690 RepID=A0A9X7YEW0_SPHYA|nr:pectate lyase [Sphingobium yanoikuyae]QNG48491.1 pectate lyase [Sphingobium yanoikuyae]
MSDRYIIDRRELLASAAGATLLPSSSVAHSALLSFKGAQGWAGYTKGGNEGPIVRVTTLAPSGPGSLHAAIAIKGPRRIVFEVGGVIDLGGKVLTIREPFCTIAGQTAPWPGVTLIRGGLVISSHDVVVRHLRVRPGSAGFAKHSGWECDAINVFQGSNVIVDHCSLSWSTDESLSASGPRFGGKTPTAWRAGTSHRITFSNNIVAEGLAHSTHSHGEHSKGGLIHYNVGEVLITGNIYASNRQRNPLFDGGARGAIVNNMIYNPASQAVMLSSQPEDIGDHLVPEGKVAILANVLQPGPSTLKRLPLLRVSGGNWRVLLDDNVLLGGAQLVETPLPSIILACKMPFSVPAFEVLPGNQVREYVLANAGAQPWQRDPIDARIIAEVRAGNQGAIIDDQSQVGGYPTYRETRRAFEPAHFTPDTLDYIQ